MSAALFDQLQTSILHGRPAERTAALAQLYQLIRDEAPDSPLSQAAESLLRPLAADPNPRIRERVMALLAEIDSRRELQDLELERLAVADWAASEQRRLAAIERDREATRAWADDLLAPPLSSSNGHGHSANGHITAPKLLIPPPGSTHGPITAPRLRAFTPRLAPRQAPAGDPYAALRILFGLLLPGLLCMFLGAFSASNRPVNSSASERPALREGVSLDLVGSRTGADHLRYGWLSAPDAALAGSDHSADLAEFFSRLSQIGAESYIDFSLDPQEPRQVFRSLPGDFALRFNLMAPGLSSELDPGWTLTLRFHYEGSQNHDLLILGRSHTGGWLGGGYAEAGQLLTHRFDSEALPINGLDSTQVEIVVLDARLSVLLNRQSLYSFALDESGRGLPGLLILEADFGDEYEAGSIALQRLALWGIPAE